MLPALTSGYRNSRYAPEWVEYRVGERTLRVEYIGGEPFNFTVDGKHSEVLLVSATERDVCFEDDGLRHRVRVVQSGARVFCHTLDGSVALVEEPRFPELESAVAHGACVAPMPGKVVKLLVAEGQKVEAGDVLLILEAMKMEHSVKAPDSGVVEKVLVSEGEQVDADAVLAVIGEQE